MAGEFEEGEEGCETLSGIVVGMRSSLSVYLFISRG